MQVFNKSNRYKSYIPFLYYVWVDNVLTAGEWDVINAAIKSDNDLSDSEKQELTSYLNSDEAPKTSIFSEWREWIDQDSARVDIKDKFPLSSYVQRLTGIENLDVHNHIESTLDLRPIAYRHVFPFKEIEKEKMNTEELADLSNFFNPNYQELTKKIHHILNDELFSWRIVRNKEELRTLTLERIKKLAEHGLGKLAYSKSVGGNDDLPAYGLIFEQLITVDPSLAVKFGVQFGLFGGAVANLGTEKHHNKWLKDIGNGDLLGCFAMTETGHGSNVRGLQTRATYHPEDDSIVVHTPTENDSKEYIGNALDSKVSVVFAQLIVKGVNYGVHAMLVPLRDENHKLLPGIRVEDNGYKLGLNGVDNGKIWYDNVKIPRFNLLNRFGSIDDNGEYTSPIDSDGRRFFTMLGTLVGGRICVGLGAIKGAQYSLNLALTYAHQRRQFSSNSQKNEELLIDYPSHQLRLIPRLARTLTLDKALSYVMNEFANHIGSGDTKKLESQVAALKSSATWFANRAIQECREACGGKGYLTENRIADMKGDIDIFTTFEGDNIVLTQLAAKGVLSEFRERFNAGGIADVLSYMNVQFKSTLSKFNLVYSRKSDTSHLMNPSFHRHAVDYRVEELSFSVTKRLRKLIDRKISPYDAFLRVQNHIIALGEAYAHQLEVNLFYDNLENFKKDNDMKRIPSEVIDNMASLSSLSLINQHMDWYLLKGYISSGKAKAIRNQISTLNAELRPYILDIIAASDINPTYLQVPFLD